MTLAARSVVAGPGVALPWALVGSSLLDELGGIVSGPTQRKCTLRLPTYDVG